LRIPLYNIRRVEIIRGPGSALFGTSAFVAVVNLIPFSPTTFNGAKASVTAGSFGTQQYSLMAGHSGGNWGVLASAQYFDTRGAKLWIPEDQQTPIDRRAAALVAPVSLAPGFLDESLRSEDFAANGFYGKVSWNFRFKDDKGGPFLGKFDVLTNEGHVDGQQLQFDVSRPVQLAPSASLTAKFSFTQSHKREELTILPPDFFIVNPITRVVRRFPDGVKTDAAAGIRAYLGELTLHKEFTDRQRLTIGSGFDYEATYGVHNKANFSGSLTDLMLRIEPELLPRPDAIHGYRRIVSLFTQPRDCVSTITTRSVQRSVREQR
jgi:iron complex outermembrane receptor protein